MSKKSSRPALRKLSAQTLRRSTSLLTTLSILPHLFCCGIPAIMGLIALGTTVGLAATLASNPLYAFVDAWHTELLVLAFVSVAISGVLNFVAWRIDCREASKAELHGHCAHDDCTPRKNTSLKIFLISCLLLTLDVAWFLTEEKVLGLHHHGHEVHEEHHEHVY
jgi:hypothetical protein